MRAKLKRLTVLVGTDPGFYVLALHSFVEYYIRDVLNALPEVKLLESTLDAWQNRTTITERNQILRTVQRELSEPQQKNAELLSRLSDYDEKERRLVDLENRIERFTIDLDAARVRCCARSGKRCSARWWGTTIWSATSAPSDG